MAPHHPLRNGIAIFVMALGLVWLGCTASPRETGRELVFPAPPHQDAIGTQVGPISTSVSRVTLSAPVSIDRLGLVYAEIRGTIEGVGWGGMPLSLRCHYAYELPYLLRIPPDWDGGLVIHRPGAAELEVFERLETDFGDRSLGRIFHESRDRLISDVAVHPGRRWAFFAVNQVGVAPGGAHNTRLLGEPGCPEGMPTQSMVDVPIARDHALLAQRLLRVLEGREPAMTLGTGHSAGAPVHFLLNAGVDHRRDGGPIRAGDNHRTPYDPASGRIFDGFLWMQSAFGGRPLPADLAGGLSVPTIFLDTEADRAMVGSVSTIHQLIVNSHVDVTALSRLYTVRNIPHSTADGVLSLNREGTDYTNPERPEYFKGGGERLRPVTAALLDALANWTMRGIPPPPSIFNGEVLTAPDRIEFHRTGPPATSFPYVDDERVDSYDQPPPIVPGPELRTAWSNVRAALGGVVGSIVLPETACRRGAFHFFGAGPIGTHFQPFTASAFLDAWGSSAAHQSCRVQTVDALVAAGLYDPTFVTIDIVPDGFPNVVDLRSPERLPVAIFTTRGFDATEIVPGSLRLAGARMHGVAADPGEVRTQVVDVNGDGRADLLVDFPLDRLRFGADDMVADLWGVTRQGVPFSGSDLIDLIR